MRKFGSLISIKAAQVLLGLTAIIWVSFGAVSLFTLAEQNPEQIVLFGLIAILMFGNAGAMLLASWLLGKRWKSGFYLALAVLLVNVILTLTDQFGIFDLITFILDLILLGILIAKRSVFIRSPGVYEANHRGC